MTTQDENKSKVFAKDITNEFETKITSFDILARNKKGNYVEKFIEKHNLDSDAHSAIIEILNAKNNSQDVEIAKKASISSLSAVATSGAYSDLTGTPALSDVATSGSYNDLADKPTIPTVPTNVSAFTNDAGYLTSSTLDINPHALKGYEDAGELLTDPEGLADVTKYAHSTFDLSKFTVVGTPTITDDGIASGFSTSNYVSIANLGDITTKPFKIYINMTKNSSWDTGYGYIYGYEDSFFYVFGNDGGTQFSIYINNNGTKQDILIGTLKTVPIDTKRRYCIEWNGVDTYTVASLDTTESPISVTSAYPPYTNTQRIGQTNRGLSVDLNEIRCVVDGIPVFSGNKTGTDTYTIGGSTVNIPYTLSKTGSKIVDSAYRTQVSAVYEAFGKAPYYTLNEGVNFTLPQGEIYGLMSTVIETYKNGSSWYRVYADGWCEQGGYLATDSTSVKSYTVNFLKPFVDTNYAFNRSPYWAVDTNPQMDSIYDNGYRTKTASSITFSMHESTKQNGTEWSACGYIN